MQLGIRCVERPFGTLIAETKEIHVPLYQREYAWKKEQIERLWSDALESMAEPQDSRTFFLGSLVFHDEEATPRSRTYLVDGQQRVITLSLLLGVARQRLIKLIQVDPGAKLVTSATLTLSKINELLYQTEAEDDDPIAPPFPLRVIPSAGDQKNFRELLRSGNPTDKRKLLFKAWSTLSDLFDTAVQERLSAPGNASKDPDPTGTRLLQLEAELALSRELEPLFRKTLMFSVIRVGHPYNPLLVFESLNSTGLDLAQSDLVKNWIVGKVESALRKEAVTDWNAMTSLLPRNEVTSFLRYWYISKHGHVSVKKLYERIKLEVHDSGSVWDHLKEWKIAAGWYRALVTGQVDAETRKEHGLSSGASQAFGRIATLGFQQARPVLMAAIRGGHVKKLSEIHHVLETIYIRGVKSESVRGSKFEGHLEEMCRCFGKEFDLGLLKLRDVADKIVARNRLDWTSFTPEDRNLQKLILSSLEGLEQGAAWNAPPASEIEVEHVLPQTRKGGTYGSFSLQEFESLLNHIGNLTLILERDNPRCGNQTFEEKKKVYAEYDGTERMDPESGNKKKQRLALTHKLSLEPGDWTPVVLLKRASVLARMADEVWPVKRLTPEERQKLLAGLKALAV